MTEEGSDMKKCIILIASLSILYLNACSKTDHRHHEGHNHEGTEAQGAHDVSGYVKNGVRIVKLRASRYKFEPDPIVVKHMEKVRLIATSSDMTHGIAIPDFKVELTIPPGGKSETEFIADKKGVFHAHCSVYCGPGHSHMHGQLIVE